MYADDLATKPKIFAMTPEIGPDNHGFWPPSNQIIPICKSTVFQNLNAAHLAWVFGLVQDANGAVIEDQSGFLKYDMKRLGLEPGNLDVSISPVGFGIASVGSANTHNLVSILDTETDSIAYTLDPGLLQGQSFSFELAISNGLYTWRDTLTKVYGQGQVVYANNGSSMADWNSSSWNTTGSDYYSPSTSITDSPNGNYPDQTTSTITLAQTIDLTDALSATASFWAKWEIEDNWDYVQFQVSSDGGSSWTPMCGLYTQTGTSNQDDGEPVFDGFQTTWVQEEIDLIDFIGDVIEVRFRLVSDNYVNEDGFYFDDFEIIAVTDQEDGITENSIDVGLAMPNPAIDYTYIPYNIQEEGMLHILDMSGKEVMSVQLNPGRKKVRLNTSNLAHGVYVYNVETSGRLSSSQRFAVLK